MTHLFESLRLLVIGSVLVALSACDFFVSSTDRIERARKEIASGDDRAAVIELQNALKAEPNNVGARLLLAETSLRMGDVRATVTEIQKAKESGATDAQLSEITADLRLAQGAYAELLEEIASGKLVLEADKLLVYKGHGLRGLGRTEEALFAFREAVAANSNSSAARIGLAEALAGSGRVEDALRETEAVIAADRTDANAWLTKGSLLARQGDYTAASRALSEARSNAAGQLTPVRYLGLLSALIETQLAAGDIGSARATHGELTKHAPDVPLTRLLAARIAMSAQDFSTASAEAQRALSAAPELGQAKLLLGAALLAQGNSNQAERHLAELVRAAPENVEARKLLAQAYLQMQRPDAAAQVLAPMQKTDSNDAQLNALLGWTSLQQGQESEAISRLERSVAAQPTSTPLKLDLAMAYLRGERPEKAVDLLRAVSTDSGDLSAKRDMLLVAAVGASKGGAAARSEIDRLASSNVKDAAMLITVASLYSRFGEIGKARDSIQRALAIEPKNTGAYMALARIELLNGDRAAAQTAVDHALKVEPESEQLLTARAELALQAGKNAEAISMLEKIRARHPNSIRARFLLARAFLLEKKAADADKLVGEILKSGGGAAEVNSSVGRLYLEVGRYDQALAQFRMAARSEPNDPEHLMNAARAQLALSDSNGARESVEAALKLRPNSIEANSIAVMLDMREGRRDAAVQRLASLKKSSPDDATVWLLEGDLALSSREFGQAATAYAHASRLSPTASAAIREYRARALGKLANATEPLERWLRQQPEDVAARLVLAESYAGQGDSGRAIEQYEVLLQNEIPNAMAMNNLAWLYHQKGDARAAELAAKAYKLAPEIPGVADTYGWILVQSGQVQPALPILKQASIAPNAPLEIRYHYAFALAKSGDRTAARRELDEVLQHSKGTSLDQQARQLLTELGG